MLILLDHKNNTKKTMFIWTVCSLLLGSMVYPLTLLMPLNKKIWSISFVFLTVASSGLALTIVTELCDILPKNHKKYARVCEIVTRPLIWLGRNPLAIFVLMMILEIILSDLIIIN